MTTEYLTNNRNKVTKEYNGSTSYDTTTQYLAFGAPNHKNAIEIISQVGNGKADVVTKIQMNVFEEIEQVTQHESGAASDIVEYRVYDSNHNLCKINRPDVGMTAFEYSTGGELLWQAQNVTSANNTSCETVVSDDIKVHFSYDNLGDQYQITYPANDSTPNLTHRYDDQGNLTKLTAGSVIQDYGYDVRGLLETETLNVEGEIFTLGYSYNNLNHLSSITYPGADVGTVQFTPNAFGLATKAQSTTQTYASGALYHPNNSIAKFKYGNNFYHFVGLNNRQLPATLADCTSSDETTCSSSIINYSYSYSYSYDYQNNITAITDNVNNAYSINTLNYDGLERLISTSGGTSMGSSQLDYDALGNIESFLSLGSNLDHIYDASNRLTSVVDSVGTNDYTDIDYDNRGNIIKRVKNNVTDDFTYNLTNQMVKANDTDYLYDGHNRRVAVTKNGRRTYSFYNQAGQLVYRKTPAGGISYIFMGKKLVAKDGYISESSSSAKTHYKPFGDTLSPAKDDVGYTGHKFDSFFAPAKTEFPASLPIMRTCS